MTRRCEQATIAFLLAGVLAMLACALYARFTQPSIAKRVPAQVQQAQTQGAVGVDRPDPRAFSRRQPPQADPVFFHERSPLIRTILFPAARPGSR